MKQDHRKKLVEERIDSLSTVLRGLITILISRGIMNDVSGSALIDSLTTHTEKDRRAYRDF